MSVWDDPEIAVGGDFVKFENPGDAVAGTITVARKHTFDDGKVAPQLLLLCDDGEERTVTAGQIRLKYALTEERPEAGDHITITHTHVEKRSGGKTLKHFDVKVRRGNGTVPTATVPNAWDGAPAATPAPAPAAAPAPAPVADPAAAAAAIAALSPEQRAALGL